VGSLQDLPTSSPAPWIRLKRAARRLPKWALAAGLGGALLGAAATFGLFSRGQAIESLAVLPIANETGDAAVDYAADGLTEDLIQQLSPTPHLRVIARGSIQRFKGQAVDPKAVASELGVGSLLLGRLVRRDGGIHLNLELIDARDQRRIWGGQLPRPIEDLQLVESTVTAEVARTLGLRRSKERPRVDREAYDLYLKGRYFADRYNPGDVERGFQYFDQALRRDPAFALAHVGKANAYWGLSTTFRPAGEVMPKAMIEAQMALDLDAELAEAYTIRGMTRSIVDRDQKAAEADLRRAIALNPGAAAPHLTYGYFLTYAGRYPEAFASLEQGMDRDPSSLNALGFLAIAHVFAGQYDRALTVTRRMKRLEPGFWWASFVESVALYYTGEREAALKEIEVAAASGSPYALAWKGFYLGHMGRRREALEVQTRLKALASGPATPVSHTHFALVHLGLGETEQALDELELAVKAHEEDAVALQSYPAFQELRGHPRFKELLAKTG
jgi:serine/threonine-protein kinase